MNRLTENFTNPIFVKIQAAHYYNRDKDFFLIKSDLIHFLDFPALCKRETFFCDFLSGFNLKEQNLLPF